MIIKDTKINLKNLKSLLFENINPRQIILKNSFWLYLSEFTSKFLHALLFLLIARILGPTEFGAFSYLISFIGIFFLFADFGINHLLIRDYQQKEEKEKYVRNAFYLKIFLSLIFFFISLFGFFLVKKVDGFLMYLLISLFFALKNLRSFFINYFIAVQKVEKNFILDFVESVLTLVLALLGLLFYKNILSIALAYLLSMSISLLLAIKILRDDWHWIKKFDFSLFSYYFHNGLPLVFFGFLGYIFFNTDQIILGYLRGVEEVGYYSVASKIVLSLFLVPYLFNTALYPYLSGEKRKEKIESIFNKIVLGSLISGFILSLLVFFLSPFLIVLLFGKEYFFSVYLLEFFIWILIFVFPTTFLDYFLISKGKQWLDFWITLVPALLNIILNLIFIPLYGALGAIFASLISQAVNFFLSLYSSYLVLKSS